MDNFKESLQNNLSKVGFALKKASPEIFIALGIGGVVGGTILACAATLDAKKRVEEHKDTIKGLKHMHEESVENDAPNEGYSQEALDHDIGVTYLKTAGDLFFMYAPAIGLELLSIAAILTSHHIQKERTIGLATALATVTSGFKEYRQNVVEKYGEDEDLRFRHNVKTETVEDTIIGEDGKKKKVKKTIESVKDGRPSPYSKFYTRGCNGWCEDPEYNFSFLKLQQDHATNKLRGEGHLFLNEVYDMLGIPRTREGQYVGWIYKKDNPNGNYVDFGIYLTNKENNTNFVNRLEPTILLDFNVDGYILDDVNY